MPNNKDGLPISHIWLNSAEHIDSSLINLHKHPIEDLIHIHDTLLSHCSRKSPSFCN